MAFVPQYDVVVAGAGPAGSAAAIMLQRAGARVCLVDDVQSDGPKVGESLPGAVHRLLYALGINGIADLLPKHHYQGCVANVSAWGSEQWTYQDALTNPEGGGWHIDRMAFDTALQRRARLAGVPFYQTQITDVAPDPQTTGNQPGYQVQLAPGVRQSPAFIRTKWLIDATGRRAFISRRLQQGRQRLANQMAGVCWVATSPTDYDRTTRIKSAPDGWWYTARLPSGFRVISFQSLPETIADRRKNPADFLHRFNTAFDLAQPVNEQQPVSIRVVDASVSRPFRVAQPGLLCVGDAALSNDPLSSQGIFFALYSGIKGAEAIVRCITTPPISTAALTMYQQQVDEVFAANQRSRGYFYASESRYASEVFWQTRFVQPMVADV